MKSSSAKGACSVCDHLNSVHIQRTCIAKGCKQKIKVCGASYHYLLDAYGNQLHHNGDVVCRECPDLGRTSKSQNFDQSPLVGKNGDGNLGITKEGVIRNF
jgi:hypothetical protein